MPGSDLAKCRNKVCLGIVNLAITIPLGASFCHGGLKLSVSFFLGCSAMGAAFGQLAGGVWVVLRGIGTPAAPPLFPNSFGAGNDHWRVHAFSPFSSAAMARPMYSGAGYRFQRVTLFRPQPSIVAHCNSLMPLALHSASHARKSIGFMVHTFLHGQSVVR